MSPRVFIGAVAVAFAVAALVLFAVSLVSAARARRERERVAAARPEWAPPPVPGQGGADLDLSGLEVSGPARTPSPTDEPTVLDRIEWWSPTPDHEVNSAPAGVMAPPRSEEAAPVASSAALPFAAQTRAETTIPDAAEATTDAATTVAAEAAIEAPDATVPTPTPAASDAAGQPEDLAAILETLEIPAAADASEDAPGPARNAGTAQDPPVPQVELVVGGKRVTVREGSPTHLDFKRYADALLADLKDCRDS